MALPSLVYTMSIIINISIYLMYIFVIYGLTGLAFFPMPMMIDDGGGDP